MALSFTAGADETKQEQQADKSIQQLYHSQTLKPTFDISKRVEIISARFLEKPYLLSALGEGRHAHFDQFPLYRIDAFDCETYVDTVLALAFADSLASFKQCIRRIRYKNGAISFIYRNHFTCLDWNKNNQKQGFLKDITTTLHDENKRPVAKVARALINKPGWYAHFSPSIIRINASLAEQARRLVLLKQEGHALPEAESIIPYIPLTALFNKSGDANTLLFNQIPTGAIIEIIRPNWDLEQQIGTRLNVSHLGFAVWEKNVLMFRSASSNNHQVMDCPLIDYLRDAQKSPTIRGINIQIISKSFRKKSC